MQCKYCNVSWEIPKDSELNINKCPFCNRKIVEEILHEKNSVKEIIKSNYKKEGMKFFYDTNRVFAILGDLCPNEKIERYRIRTALLGQLPQLMYNIVFGTYEDKDRRLCAIKKDFILYFEVTDEVFEYAKNCIFFAWGVEDNFNWDYYKENNDKKAKHDNVKEIVFGDANHKSTIMKKSKIDTSVNEETSDENTDNQSENITLNHKSEYGFDASNWCAMGRNFMALLHNNGQVTVSAYNTNLYDDVTRWKNIVSITANGDNVYGLNNKGQVCYVGKNTKIRDKVRGWDNIVSIMAGNNVLYGLSRDGKVVSTNSHYDSTISKWNNVNKLCVSDDIVVGIMNDGTIISNMNWINKLGWHDIIYIVIYRGEVVGIDKSNRILKADKNQQYNTYNIDKKYYGEIKSLAITRTGTIEFVSSNKNVYRYIYSINEFRCVDRIGKEEKAKRNLISICCGDYATAYLTDEGEVIAPNVFSYEKKLL